MKAITVAVVGTRRATNAQRDQVRAVLSQMTGADGMVLTGHAGGICAEAELWARKRGQTVIVLQPDYAPGQDYQQAVRALYERDRLLVQAADLVLAWPAADRRGGTEEEIRQCRKQGRPCLLCQGPPPWAWEGMAPETAPAWLAGLVRQPPEWVRGVLPFDD